MTAIAIADAPTRQRADDDDLSHVYCCDPDTALCGADLSNTPEDESVETDCVVCLDLEATVAACCAGCPGAVTGRG